MSSNYQTIYKNVQQMFVSKMCHHLMYILQQHVYTCQLLISYNIISQMRESALTGQSSQSNNFRYLSIFAKLVSQRCKEFVDFFIENVSLCTLERADIGYQIQNILLNKLVQVFHYSKPFSKSEICEQTVKNNQFSFKCYDCCLSKDSYLCVQCFNRGNHLSHSFQKIYNQEIRCSCGDSDYINEGGHCKNHEPKYSSYMAYNRRESELYIKQMQFLFYLLYQILNQKQFKNYPQLHKIYFISLIKYIKYFCSNNIQNLTKTVHLLKSKFATGAFAKDIENLTTYQFIYNFDNNTDICNNINELFLLLDSVQQFKKLKAVHRIQNMKYNPKIMLSASNYNIQPIFSLETVMKKIIQQQRTILPYQIIAVSRNLTSSDVCAIFGKYFIELNKIANLKNDLNRQYVKFHFEKGDVSNMSNYEFYLKEDYFECLNKQYWIQYRYLQTIALFISLVKSEKQLLIKQIMNIVRSLQQNEGKYELMTLFNPKPRTFLLLIYAFFEGDVSKAASKQFFKFVKLNQNIFYKMFQSVLYTLRFYAYTLSNQSIRERYQQFYWCVFSHWPRLILSIDIQLAKFCFLSIKYFSSNSQQTNQYKLKADYFQPLRYDQSQMKFEKLIQFPTKFITSLINENKFRTKQDTYDRHKALNYLTNYLCLLEQIGNSTFQKLNLNNFLMMNNQIDIRQFYGRLIKKFQPLRIEELNQVCDVIFNDRLHPQKQEFLKYYCEVENKVVRLAQQCKQKFQPIGTSYIELNRLFEPFQRLLHQTNSNKLAQKQKSRSYADEILRTQLYIIMFNSQFIESISFIVDFYIKKMICAQNILESDFHYFQNLVSKLIYLNQTLKNKQIYKIICKLYKQGILVRKFSDKFSCQVQNEISNIYRLTETKQNQYKFSNRNVIPESDKELKAKKLKKFREKQTQIFQKFMSQVDESPSKQINELNDEQFLCVVCKQNDNDSPLIALVNIQKSSLFWNLYIKQIKSVYFLTSCQHLIHRECMESNQCFYCRNPSDLQLLMPNNLQRNLNTSKNMQTLLNVIFQLYEDTDIMNEKFIRNLYNVWQHGYHMQLFAISNFLQNLK